MLSGVLCRRRTCRVRLAPRRRSCGIRRRRLGRRVVKFTATVWCWKARKRRTESGKRVPCERAAIYQLPAWLLHVKFLYPSEHQHGTLDRWHWEMQTGLHSGLTINPLPSWNRFTNAELKRHFPDSYQAMKDEFRQRQSQLEQEGQAGRLQEPEGEAAFPGSRQVFQ